jgi:hypothetical protein
MDPVQLSLFHSSAFCIPISLVYTELWWTDGVDMRSESIAALKVMSVP